MKRLLIVIGLLLLVTSAWSQQETYSIWSGSSNWNVTLYQEEAYSGEECATELVGMKDFVLGKQIYTDRLEDIVKQVMYHYKQKEGDTFMLFIELSKTRVVTEGAVIIIQYTANKNYNYWIYNMKKR